MYNSRVKPLLLKYSLILKNASYMSVLKLTVMLLPLVTYPYLIRTLGANKFGLVIYAISIVAFLRVLIKFGFELSAVKAVSEASGDHRKISSIFTSVILSQAFLFVLSIFILVVLIATFESVNDVAFLLFFALLLPLSDIFMMTWLFQAIQKMKYITYVNVMAGLINIAGVFIFIKSAEHYVFVPLIQGASFLVASVLAMVIILRSGIAGFCKVTFQDVVEQLKSSLSLFVSRISAIFNSEFTVILLANFVGPSAVSFYDLSKKIIEVFKMPNSVINIVVFPHIARTKSLDFVNWVLFIRIILALLLSLVAYITYSWVIEVLGGKEVAEGAASAFLIMMPLIIITSITYYTGTSILVSFGHIKEFNISVILTSLIYLVIVAIMNALFGLTLEIVLYSMLLSELFLMMFRLVVCYKLNLIGIRHFRK